MKFARQIKSSFGSLVLQQSDCTFVDEDIVIMGL